MDVIFFQQDQVVERESILESIDESLRIVVESADSDIDSVANVVTGLG